MMVKRLASISIAIFFVILMAYGEGESFYDSMGQEFVLVIDNSKSIKDLDPGHERFDHALLLVDELGGRHRFGFLVYLDKNTYRLHKLSSYNYINKEFLEKIKRSNINAEDMDLSKCLNMSVSMFSKSDEADKSIIFLSDGVIYTGFDQNDRYRFEIDDPKPDDEKNPRISALKRSLKDIKDKKIKINTVYIGDDPHGQKLLENMSIYTGGTHTSLNPPILLKKNCDISLGYNGTLVNFTINVTNTGNATLDQVMLTDSLPEGLDYIGSTDDGHHSENIVTWYLGWLDKSGSRVVHIEARINRSEFGHLTNKASVTGSPPSGSNVTSSDSEDVLVDTASISVNKTANPSSGYNGTLVNFTINVTNTGNATLDQVILTDSLPEGLDYIGSTDDGHHSENIVTWDLGWLDKSGSRVVHIKARINMSESSILTNVVRVEGKPESGYNATDNDSEDIPINIASISVNKTSKVSAGSNGTLINFTIGVTNTGNATLKPVTVTDTLPEGLDYVSSKDNGTNSRNNVTWELGELNASESRSIYLEARINRSESGVLTNFVLVDGKPESGYNVSAYTSSNVTVLPPNATFIVFALDTSGSMRKYYRLDPNESAEIVSTWSHFGNATVSIVSWDHRSDLLFGPAPLVGNEARLAEILDNLSEMCVETDLTYYDEGLNGSLAVLRDYADGWSKGSAKIIVFLTGFSEFEPGNRLDEYISEANESGYKVFTIGLGIESNFSASEKQYLHLTKISDGAGGEFQAVATFSSEELKTVMETIVKRVEILGIPAEPRSG